MREGAWAVPPGFARKIAATAKMVWHYEHGSILSSGQAVSHPEPELVLRQHKGLPRAVQEVAEGSVQPHAVLVENTAELSPERCGPNCGAMISAA